jgi:hypothetical protein
MVLICLSACCLFSSLSFAQTIEPKMPALLPEQAAELEPLASNDSEDPQVGGGRQKTAPPTATDPATSAPVTPAYKFPSGSEVTRDWVRGVIGPRAFVGAAFTASWNQWATRSPKEWGRDAEGWGQRFGAAWVDTAINQSSLTLLSAAMGQDPLYYRCACSGLWPRTRHAVKMGFMSRNRSGDAVFAPPKIIAPFTGPLVTRNTIYPGNHSASEIFNGGGPVYYLAGGVLWNLVKEFVWKAPQR